MAFRLAANGCNLDDCTTCGFVQVRNIPSDEDLRAIYQTAYFEKPKYVDDLAAQHEFNRRLQLLKNVGLQASWNVLDYGCAAGEFVHGIATLCSPHGADFSSEGIAKAKDRYPELASRFTTLGDISDISFDAIVMWDVIEHVPEPRQALAEIAARLRDGGALILSTPNIGAGIAKLMGRRWAFMTPPEHLGFFDRTSMTRAIEQAGLQIESWGSHGKLVNFAFLIYKAGRVFPALVPRWLSRFIAGSPLAKLCIYVPTGDIQYVVCRKPALVEP